MPSIIKSKKILLGLLALSLIVNIVFVYRWYMNTVGVDSIEKKYPLISKRILFNPQNDITVNFLPLRNDLQKTVAGYNNTFALYFEYLPTGTSIGINEDSEFTAASLLKVPVVMAYYAKKERMGIQDDPTVTIQQNELNSKFGDLYKKGAGTQINLADAVRLALTESDNTASLILADQISNDDFMYVYEGLDITPALKGDSPIVTAVQYTSILKALYFASVLNKDDSEKILNYLTHTEFHNLLPSGIPDNIPVAHKIGLIDKQIYQDCGIVYVPNRPYALCMISKSDKDTAAKRMQTITGLVYKYVSGNSNQFSSN